MCACVRVCECTRVQPINSTSDYILNYIIINRTFILTCNIILILLFIINIYIGNVSDMNNKTFKNVIVLIN